MGLSQSDCSHKPAYSRNPLRAFTVRMSFNGPSVFIEFFILTDQNDTDRLTCKNTVAGSQKFVSEILIFVFESLPDSGKNLYERNYAIRFPFHLLVYDCSFIVYDATSFKLTVKWQQASRFLRESIPFMEF